MTKIIAEIGCNHMGSIEIAKELIDLAKDSGVSYVKFQKRNNKELLTEDQYNAPHPNPLNSYQSWSYDTLNITNTGCNVRIRPDFIITCDAGPIQQGNFVLRYYNLLNGTWPSIPYNIDANGNAYGFWNTLASDSTGYNFPLLDSKQMIIRVKFLIQKN